MYLGESDDYLADGRWEEEGFLPFGDESEAENPEPFSDKGEQEEEDTGDPDEEFDKWTAANREKSTGPTEYWAIAEDMKKSIDIIRSKQADSVRKAAAAE